MLRPFDLVLGIIEPESTLPGHAPARSRDLGKRVLLHPPFHRICPILQVPGSDKADSLGSQQISACTMMTSRDSMKHSVWLNNRWYLFNIRHPPHTSTMCTHLTPSCYIRFPILFCPTHAHHLLTFVLFHQWIQSWPVEMDSCPTCAALLIPPKATILPSPTLPWPISESSLTTQRHTHSALMNLPY